ncbi:MAG TPA: nuclear transport factor 2 family protein [Pyrinomonadaceae bacterium]|jgi:ketosteroid isomerase-like protein
MEPRRSDTFVSPTEETVRLEEHRTPPPPRFDDKSVQRAQPAVPLGQRALSRARSWPATLVVLCVLGGVAGGLLGGLALSYFQRGGPDARVQGQTAAAARQESGGAAAQTAPRDAKPAADSAGATPAASTQPSEVAAQPDAAPRPAAEQARASEAPAPADASTEGELRAALGEWLAATNSRDVGRQMSYYAPRVEAFYLSRNAPREAVRAEKARLFSRASSVNIQATRPEIQMSRDGRTAVMRFRKRYQITGEDSRSGEVLQELRWRRTDGGWKIVGERDLRVLQ